jgi:FMN phosphatase YigB (HAD superfamily)
MVSAAGRRPPVSMLITDLDNTLWDWFEAWFRSFSAMLDRLSSKTGISKEQLENEIREVHQRHGTSEYTFLLAELPSLRQRHLRDTDIMREYDDVVHALNKERKQSTRLYPGVRETLLRVRTLRTPIIAYTESIAYWTEWRMRALKLDGLIDVLFSSPNHDTPSGVDVTNLRTRPDEEHGLKETKHLHVPAGILKPNRQILDKILTDHQQDPKETVYIGDSLMKDVAMAQDVGVIDVHARYGDSQAHLGYALLQRVSHWTPEDVEREQQIRQRPRIVATYTIDAFDDLLGIFSFGSAR